jgi:hypothetical protein
MGHITEAIKSFMKNRQHCIFLLIFISCILIQGCYPRNTPSILHGLVLDGFAQVDALMVYNKDNLFDYMNGEAEVYFPFGFRLLYVIRYEDVAHHTQMMVEVFDLGSRSGAQGVFQKYTQELGSEIKALGDSAWTDTYIVLVWRGTYFLRITPDYASSGENSPDLEELVRFAGSVDRALVK